MTTGKQGVNGWLFNGEDGKYEAEEEEGEVEIDCESKGYKKKEGLLKEMTPSWFTEWPCA